jgi:hypothetical protein
MDEGLKRNILIIRDPSKPRAEFGRLEDKLAKAVFEELIYACTIWTDHLVDINGAVSQNFVEALYYFLFTHLLSWIELMAWRKMLQNAVEAMSQF